MKNGFRMARQRSHIHHHVPLPTAVPSWDDVAYLVASLLSVRIADVNPWWLTFSGAYYAPVKTERP